MKSVFGWPCSRCLGCRRITQLETVRVDPDGTVWFRRKAGVVCPECKGTGWDQNR